MHEKIPNSNDQNNKQKNAVDYQRAMDKFWNLVLVICYLFVFWCLRFVILECGIKKRRNVSYGFPIKEVRDETEKKNPILGAQPRCDQMLGWRAPFIHLLFFFLPPDSNSLCPSLRALLIHRISERLGQHFDNPGNIGDEHEGHDHHRVEGQQ
jgi:hypothetical protein